jgi:hypothetical protein
MLPITIDHLTTMLNGSASSASISGALSSTLTGLGSLGGVLTTLTLSLGSFGDFGRVIPSAAGCNGTLLPMNAAISGLGDQLATLVTTIDQLQMQLRTYLYAIFRSSSRAVANGCAEGIPGLSGLGFLLALIINTLATVFGQVKMVTAIVQKLLNSVTTNCPSASTVPLTNLLGSLNSLSGVDKS